MAFMNRIVSIAEFDEVKTIASQHNAYATVISGAGPTILIFSRKENSGELVRALNRNSYMSF